MKDTLIKLFNDLNKNNINYCIWGGYKNLPYEINGSDIDIIVDKIDSKLFSILYQNGFIVAKKSIYGGIPIVFVKYINGEWIPLHIITPIMPTKHQIAPKNFYKYCKKRENFKIVIPELETVITFFHSISKNKITQKRLQRIKNNYNSFTFDKKIFKELIDNILIKQNYFYDLIYEGRFDEIFHSIKKIRNIENSIRYSKSNFKTPVSKLRNFINKIDQKYKNRGKIIAITGIDGAGKTTFIDKYSTPYNKPQLFIKKSMSTDFLPKFLTRPIRKVIYIFSGRNNKFYKIFLFLLYIIQLLLDYLAMLYNLFEAYFITFTTGKHIIFDRYSIDHVNKRVNSNWFFYELSKVFYIILFPKPDIFIYFDIKPNKALERKQEDSIEILTKKYNSFEKLLSKYKIAEILVRINAEASPKEVEIETLSKIWKILLKNENPISIIKTL